MIFDKLIKHEEEIIKLVTQYSDKNGNLLLTYLNQHCYNIYYSDPEYKNLLDSNFIVFMDGLGIYVALKLFWNKNIKRFNATDTYSKIFRSFSTDNKKIFIIGGDFSDEFITQEARKKHLIISGYENGYFGTDKIDEMISSINKSSAEIIILGMGVPKQEIIASKIDTFLQNKIILCVGGFLEFYFGTKKRAPKLFRNTGFEWLFRLITEPIRLWERYLIGIPVFLYRIIKLKLTLSNK